MIREELSQMTKNLCDTFFLDVLEKGKLSETQWQEFAQQRYLAAKTFEQLLETGIKKAEEINDTELATALKLNLCDEKGVTQNGKPLPTGSHETWRKYFYNTIRVNDESLSKAIPFKETKIYDETMKQLIQESALTLAGAILFQEYSIPEEFKRIKMGRDTTFFNEFVTNPYDTKEQRHKKVLARLYIDHHIKHDADNHYPILEKALTKYLNNPEDMKQILKGVMLMFNARQTFYQGLIKIYNK